MATERQAPDAIVETNTHLSGSVTDIDEDPDSPDANWLTHSGGNTNTYAHVSFPTPTGDPTPGSGLQQVKAWVRRTTTGSGNAVTGNIEVWDTTNSPSKLVASLAPTTISSGTGQMLSMSWDATGLTSTDGSGVECWVIQTDGGTGTPENRRHMEIGAVEWNVDYSTPIAISPGVGGMSITERLPTVDVSITNDTITPGLATLTASGVTPGVSVSGTGRLRRVIIT